MNWKKVLRITAVTVIPGGLAILGGWMLVKKFRSSRDAEEKSPSDLAQPGQEQAGKEAKHDVHPLRIQ